MEADSPNTPIRSLTEAIFVLFLRVVALSCLWFGLQYWALLVGYSHNGSAALTSCPRLGVRRPRGSRSSFPCAALGLWVAGSWGR